MFTQKHYEFFAKFFGPQIDAEIYQSEIVEHLVEEFKKDSPKFDEAKFNKAMRKACEVSESESRQRGRLIYHQATYHQNDPGPCGLCRGACVDE